MVLVHCTASQCFLVLCEVSTKIPSLLLKLYSWQKYCECMEAMMDGQTYLFVHLSVWHNFVLLNGWSLSRVMVLVHCTASQCFLVLCEVSTKIPSLLLKLYSWQKYCECMEAMMDGQTYLFVHLSVWHNFVLLNGWNLSRVMVLVHSTASQCFLVLCEVSTKIPSLLLKLYSWQKYCECMEAMMDGQTYLFVHLSVWHNFVLLNGWNSSSVHCTASQCFLVLCEVSTKISLLLLKLYSWQKYCECMEAMMDGQTGTVPIPPSTRENKISLW